ncbi:MAG: thiamine phosphate synthase [Chloroflexi bacterium]|nr:thiamine phosphate synthase [Chloroflexota bacterium]
MPTKLLAPCVALVTDRRVSGGVDALLAAVEAAVAGGVSLVQMREKDLPDAEQLVLARRLRELTAGRALLFVNDSVSIAQAAGADGVQLAERSRTVASARDATALDALGRGRLLVGRSVHDLAGATEAAEQGADLLVVGAVFETATHPGQPAVGTGLVEQIASAVSVPVLGIGGITAANAADVIVAGAAGVAVVTGVLAAGDPQDAARAICDAVQHAWAARSRG